MQIVDRMFRAGGGTAYQLLGALTGPKSMRRAVATLPVADADIALTGRLLDEIVVTRLGSYS